MIIGFQNDGHEQPNFLYLQDELETHSKPGSISVFVHYGGDRTNDPKIVADNDVVLTTYGVLAAAYKCVRIITMIFKSLDVVDLFDQCLRNLILVLLFDHNFFASELGSRKSQHLSSNRMV